LEDKLSVIAKNSSPNASPVQLSVVMGKKNIPCSLFQTISKIVVSGTCHLKKRVISYICVWGENLKSVWGGNTATLPGAF